jgi:hypothetical protein
MAFRIPFQLTLDNDVENLTLNSNEIDTQTVYKCLFTAIKHEKVEAFEFLYKLLKEKPDSGKFTQAFSGVPFNVIMKALVDSRLKILHKMKDMGLFDIAYPKPHKFIKWAYRSGKYDSVQFLEELGKIGDYKITHVSVPNLNVYVAKTGDLEMLKHALDMGCNDFTRSDLDECVYRGYSECAKFILDKYNYPVSIGILESAVISGKENLFLFLMGETKETDFEPVIRRCCMRDNLEFLKHFLNKGYLISYYHLKHIPRGRKNIISFLGENWKYVKKDARYLLLDPDLFELDC